MIFQILMALNGGIPTNALRYYDDGVESADGLKYYDDGVESSDYVEYIDA